MEFAVPQSDLKTTAVAEQGAETPDPMLLLYGLLPIARTGGADVNLRQLLLLLLLYSKVVAPTVRATSAVMGVPKSAVVRAMDKLTILGLARRKSHASDNRLVDLMLTANGLNMARKIHASMRVKPAVLQYSPPSSTAKAA